MWHYLQSQVPMMRRIWCCQCLVDKGVKRVAAEKVNLKLLSNQSWLISMHGVPTCCVEEPKSEPHVCYPYLDRPLPPSVMRTMSWIGGSVTSWLRAWVLSFVYLFTPINDHIIRFVIPLIVCRGSSSDTSGWAWNYPKGLFGNWVSPNQTQVWSGLHPKKGNL